MLYIYQIYLINPYSTLKLYSARLFINYKNCLEDNH